jgi:glucokinase
VILVGDVGGTHTRLALAELHGNDWRFSRLEQSPTQPGLEAAIQGYLEAAGRPALAGAAFCGAGPVGADGAIRLTNAGLRLEPAALAAAAGVARVALINDFAAIAHAVPRLPAAALVAIGAGRAAPDAPRLVLGPGTGLGIALAVPDGGGWRVVAGEGGHADLAPVDHEELEAWRRLRARHGRVSLETALSGPGLERLHAVLTSGPALGAAAIAEAAWRQDESAMRTVTLFTRWLGRAAGNLALATGARGGVYLAGGIVPAWGSRFDAAVFRTAFEDKGPRAEWLRAIPCCIVQHPEPGLYGLAVMSADSAA